MATARFSKDAAADGNGAWIVSTHPLRLFYRDQAITALSLAERTPRDGSIGLMRPSLEGCPIAR